MERSTTRAIWEWLGSPPWLPRKRGFAPDAVCWLCGGETRGEGWLREEWLTATFTNHTLAAAPWSGAICQPCAYLGSGDAWREHCAARPEMGWKSAPPLSWRSYSHVFAAGLHACPGRKGWREWLLEPPPPPFVFVLAESGQKHIVYRARVSASRNQYWVQVEEDAVLVERWELRNCMTSFEALLRQGFTREEVATGRYSQGRLGKAELSYRAEETMLAGWRRSRPQLVRICVTAAHGPVREKEEGLVE